MLSGQAAIDHLATEAIKEDECASSHWQRYHSKFKFDGSKFSGLQGFGGFGKRPTGLGLWASRLLQRRFRRYADGYGNFRTIDDLANQITLIQSREYDLDVLRQALTLSFLHSTAPDKLTENKTSCVIGDGFATMATLLVASKSAGRVVLVNLTKTLLVDLWYLQLWMGPEEFATSVGLVTDEGRVGETGEREGGGMRANQTQITSK